MGLTPCSVDEDMNTCRHSRYTLTKVVTGSSETTIKVSGIHDVTSQKTAVFPVTLKGTPKLAEQKPEVASASVSVRILIYVHIPLMFPRPQVASACFSCSPPDLNFLAPYFIFMYMYNNHCHRVTAHLPSIIIIIIIIIVGRVTQSV